MTEYNEETTESENQKVYSFDRILALATWAKVLSWVLIGAGAALLATVLFLLFSQFSSIQDISNIIFMLVYVAVGLLPIFLGVVLQFMVEGMYLLVDIEQNTSKPE
ncbi:MAG TPA: hypothetical protein PKL78_03630 [Anaerolineales bacterium]|nr:hypothetical protein [Anaerolineales bacterium]HNN12622.1 hypothetical protein [Anaerolineales bacterium]HNO31402.1 hypothetical protein [Anaerolineales bacterium]